MNKEEKKKNQTAGNIVAVLVFGILLFTFMKGLSEGFEEDFEPAN